MRGTEGGPAGPPEDRPDRRPAGHPVARPEGRNVVGGKLLPCSVAPLTGFFRDGCCNTAPEDFGLHTVCAEMTEEFLEFSKRRGNDLSTPRPEYGFAGLRPGDRWCLCAARWQEALAAGCAPPVLLEATHVATLEVVGIEVLRLHAVDLD
ncbi:DUF2237 domain-containing protein [Roseomonas sp. NAR14]|uniref:DUF2237 domain-containing protein n=1 Tax=Roseomonas acroporae TaxID=2937791 RepID=A0A9X1Y8U2_9PROT|nr:DUF2237 domain-containing protein [Roseomonas acroporae]MCK8785185.1 DUF2237 domain-containing protein [Roseomonas acroporae]